MIRRHAFCLSLIAVLSWGVPADAQEAGTENETTEPTEAETPTEIPAELLQSRTMEEIEVVVGPQGQSAFELEMQRQAALQEAIFAEARMRERREQELAWRQADPDLDDKESRIKWGYSAQAEQRMRNDMDEMYDLPIDQVKPASVFRIEF
jgi:hypothetical protein